VLIIHVGSQNKVKVGAVAEIIQEYPHLASAGVQGVEVASGVSDEPLSLDETIQGAMNRARAAFHDCMYSIGLESGMMAVPHTKTGYMDICACAIYDGREFHLGLSSAWEFPDASIAESITKGGLTINQAMHKAGLTDSKHIGSEGGAIGFFTKGRMDRKAYTKQALRTALIHLEQEFGK